MWAILGLAPSFLFLTGAIMWWNRVVQARWSSVKRRAAANSVMLVLFAAPVAPAAAQDPAIAQVSHSGRGAYEASMATLDDQFAVAWYDTRANQSQIYFTTLNADGRQLRADQRLTFDETLAFEPDVQAVPAGVVLAWYEKDAKGALTARLGSWTREGQLRWNVALSGAGRNGRNPVVRVSGARILVAWIETGAGETPAVWSRWFDLEGRSAAAPLRLASAGTTTWNLNAAIDERGVAWVAFDARVGTRNDEVFLVRIDGRSPALSRLTADDGFDSKYPDLELSGGRVALTWFDTRYGNEEIYLFVGPPGDLSQDVERRARRVTESEGESIGAYLAWNRRQVGLAWCDDSAGQHEIYFQRFNERGLPIERPRRITQSETSSLIPAIVPWRDGFALAWNEFTPDPQGIHGPNGRSEVMFAEVAGIGRPD